MSDQGKSVRPMDGVRVVDVSSFIAGPFCSAQLAEFGAEVWKAELPGIGDALRRIDWLGPALGEHNEEIYEGVLGLSKERLAVLKQAGTV